MSEVTQSQSPTQTQTLEETLNKTDLGHIIYENRKLFLWILLGLMVAIMGVIFWKDAQKSAALETSVKVFEFQNGPWKEAKDSRLNPSELVKAFEALSVDVRQSSTMGPIALEMGKFRYDKGNYSEANTILNGANSNQLNPISTFFLGLQRAVVLEKLGKIDEAISVLTPMAQVKDGLMPAKIFLELGRLYLLKGDKAQAQTQFDYILSTYPNDDLAKMAKLYRSQITQ